MIAAYYWLAKGLARLRWLRLIWAVRDARYKLARWVEPKEPRL